MGSWFSYGTPPQEESFQDASMKIDQPNSNQGFPFQVVTETIKVTTIEQPIQQITQSIPHGVTFPQIPQSDNKEIVPEEIPVEQTKKRKADEVEVLPKVKKTQKTATPKVKKTPVKKTPSKSKKQIEDESYSEGERTAPKAKKQKVSDEKPSTPKSTSPKSKKQKKEDDSEDSESPKQKKQKKESTLKSSPKAKKPKAADNENTTPKQKKQKEEAKSPKSTTKSTPKKTPKSSTAKSKTQKPEAETENATPTPKRRGRPPKNKNTEDASPNQKEEVKTPKSAAKKTPKKKEATESNDNADLLSDYQQASATWGGPWINGFTWNVPKGTLQRYLECKDNDSRLKEISVFAMANKKSILAFWTHSGKAQSEAPVIFIGSEGEAWVVASNLSQFISLQAAGLDGDMLKAWDGKDEEFDSPEKYLDAYPKFVQWAKSKKIKASAKSKVFKSIKQEKSKHPPLKKFLFPEGVEDDYESEDD